MFRLFVTFILICSFDSSDQHQADTPSAASDEESNPFFDAAKSFLNEAMEKNPDIGQSSGMTVLSGILHTLKNSDGQQIVNLLSGFNVPDSKNGAGDILTGIAGVLNKNSQGFDPKLIGQVADVLSGLADRGSDPATNEIPQHANSGPDWGAILGLASNLFSSSAADKDSASSDGAGSGIEGLLKGGGLEGLMNLLPLLTNSAPSGHVHFADSNLEDESEHKKYEKSNYLPPFMHIIHEYWEHFKTSEFGETVWRKSGLEGIFQLFVDKEGYFQIDRIFESMENTSFRRKWIRSLSSFVGEWVKHISDPATQARYMGNLKYFGNSFLKLQGYSKSVYFDPARPTESVSLITDAVLKTHFGLKINSGKYIKPAVLYIKELFKLGDSKNFLSLSHLSSQDISSKLSELLNGEIIEPILRVWRAYKYSIQHPHCDRRLICHLNQKDASPKKASGLKPGVTKLTSLIASWYLSGRTGTPFWKLYNAATEDHVCEVHYPADCQVFLDKDVIENSHSDEL